MAGAAPAADAPVSTGAPLARDLVVDVAVIGAGYSGLSAAYALQKRGVHTVVLDANPVGWGASGRNGGVVSSKFRLSFPAIERLHGLDTAKTQCTGSRTTACAWSNSSSMNSSSTAPVSNTPAACVAPIPNAP